MKVIIEHSKTKREINGSFNICGSREQLRSVARQILDCLDAHPFSYGWIQIHSDYQRSVPDTPPLHWDEGKKMDK